MACGETRAIVTVENMPRDAEDGDTPLVVKVSFSLGPWSCDTNVGTESDDSDTPMTGDAYTDCVYELMTVEDTDASPHCIWFEKVVLWAKAVNVGLGLGPVAVEIMPGSVTDATAVRAEGGSKRPKRAVQLETCEQCDQKSKEMHTHLLHAGCSSDSWVITSLGV